MTITRENYYGGERYVEGYCDSTETSALPSDVATGSHFLIVDTGDYKYYQNENVGWVDVSGSGGGGGGGGSASVATGTITFESAQGLAANAGNTVVITHGLGRTPVGVAWSIVSTSDENIGGSTYAKQIQAAGLAVSELITATNYVACINGNTYSSTVTQAYIPWNGSTGAADIFSSMGGTDTTITLCGTGSSRVNKAIPAGTTIRWFVW